MNDESTLLAKFEVLGYTAATLITKGELLMLFNRLLTSKADVPKTYPQQILDELWRQCRVNSKGQTQIREYVRVLVQATDSLHKKTETLRNRLDNFKNEKARLIKDIEIFRRQAQTDRQQQLEVRLADINRFILVDEQEIKEYVDQMTDLQAPFGNVRRRQEQLSKIVADKGPFQRPPSQLPKRYFSFTLKNLFYFGLVLLVLQIFVSISRPNFLNILASITILAMFGLNYFDAYYNKFTIVMLSISCLFDLLWLFIKLDKFCNIGQYSQYSHHSRLLHIISVLVTIIVNIGLKVTMMVILIPYRNGSHRDTIICVKVLWTWQIQLTGEPNPISKLFNTTERFKIPF